MVKSSNPDRMKENLDIFDFCLDQEDMTKIAALDTGHTCFHTRTTGYEVDEFLNKLAH